MAEIMRDDNFAGGVIEKGVMSLWERWEVREIKNHEIEVYHDEFIPPEWYKNDRLVLLLPNPEFVNEN